MRAGLSWLAYVSLGTPGPTEGVGARCVLQAASRVTAALHRANYAQMVRTSERKGLRCVWSAGCICFRSAAVLLCTSVYATKVSLAMATALPALRDLTRQSTVHSRVCHAQSTPFLLKRVQRWKVVSAMRASAVPTGVSAEPAISANTSPPMDLRPAPRATRESIKVCKHRPQGPAVWLAKTSRGRTRALATARALRASLVCKTRARLAMPAPTSRQMAVQHARRAHQAPHRPLQPRSADATKDMNPSSMELPARHVPPESTKASWAPVRALTVLWPSTPQKWPRCWRQSAKTVRRIRIHLQGASPSSTALAIQAGPATTALNSRKYPT